MDKHHCWGEGPTQYFFELTPERVLKSVESAGLLTTGRCAALNSFENRVYEVELDTESTHDRFRIVKFYRPGRWTKEQILEEHQFLKDLVEDEVPAIAPLFFPDGSGTLKIEEESQIYFSLFPKVGGRAPDEMNLDQMKRLGRLLARMHAVGARTQAQYRLKMSSKNFGDENLKLLQNLAQVDSQSEVRFFSAASDLIKRAQKILDPLKSQRIHGDCHAGNILWNDQGPFFLDFDDFVMGPCVQDFWLLIPGRPNMTQKHEEATQKLEALLEGYQELKNFDFKELKAIEVLRGLRFLHFAAWIAKRWEDPAFPLAFPHYGSPRYWADLTQDLEDQLRNIEE